MLSSEQIQGLIDQIVFHQQNLASQIQSNPVNKEDWEEKDEDEVDLEYFQSLIESLKQLNKLNLTNIKPSIILNQAENAIKIARLALARAQAQKSALLIITGEMDPNITFPSGERYSFGSQTVTPIENREYINPPGSEEIDQIYGN